MEMKVGKAKRLKNCIHMNRLQIQFVVMFCVTVSFYSALICFWPYKNSTTKQNKTPASNPLKFFKNGKISPTLNGPIFLLIFVNSIPKAAYRRQAIRETWAGTINSSVPAKSFYGNATIQVFCVFLIGLSDRKVDRNLEDESAKYKDLLQIETHESYRNMIFKIWSGFKWAENIDPRYIAKADDDIYLNIPLLLTWLYERELPRKFYTGMAKHKGRIIRFPNHRWFVSFREFNELYFPDYCIGPFYMFSGDLLMDLLTETAYVETFHVEDAYLGVLMRRLGIVAVDNSDLFRVNGYGPLLRDMLVKLRNSGELRNIICIGERLDSLLMRSIHQIYKNVSPGGRLEEHYMYRRET